MSVLKEKRTVSKAEYVNTANQIYVETVGFLTRLSARYSRLIAEGTAQLAGEVMDHTEKANKIYPSDEQRKAQRKAHLLEALNRFEGYLINTAQECIDYVRAVDRPNVKVMLDTFHMNIEEDSLTDAIRRSGKLLGHFHVGEANRRCPGPNGRFDWHAIGQALHDIGYTGDVVMEPFVRMGGQVSQDVALWRDLSGGADEEKLDQDAAASLRWLRGVMEGNN